MRLSTFVSVLLIAAILALVMAIIRAVVVGRMEGMEAEAYQYRQKAIRAVWYVAAMVVVVLVTGWL